MMRKVLFVALLTTVAVACSPDPAGDDPTTSLPLETSASSGQDSSTTQASQGSRVTACDYDAPWPSAPEDWYRATPIYVGNESPTEAVRGFAQSMEGFETVWIDRNHNGWVSAGFVGVDLAEAQRRLEAEFPDVGVVAVELPFTRRDLEAMAAEIHPLLPEGMHALNVHELQGQVAIYVGLLTAENIAIAEEAGGDHPYCLEGLDPAAVDDSPQAATGDGWEFLGVVDGSLSFAIPITEWLGYEVPRLLADQAGLEAVWKTMQFDGTAPVVDFNEKAVVAFPVGYSGSCPDTRFDGFVFYGDRMSSVVADLPGQSQVCTSDYNPRTYLVAIERSRFPAPPLHLVEWEHASVGLRVDVDIRVLGQGAAASDTVVVTLDRPRVATEMPHWMETGEGLGTQFIVPADCDLTYIGEINSVGWHLAEDSSIPDTWLALAVDGLIDLEIEMYEGPEPTAVVSGGGEEAVYVPGDEPTPGCQP